MNVNICINRFYNPNCENLLNLLKDVNMKLIILQSLFLTTIIRNKEKYSFYQVQQAQALNIIFKSQSHVFDKRFIVLG